MLRSKVCSTGSGLLLSSRLSRGFEGLHLRSAGSGICGSGFPCGFQRPTASVGGLGGGGVGGIKGSSG